MKEKLTRLLFGASLLATMVGCSESDQTKYTREVISGIPLSSGVCAYGGTHNSFAGTFRSGDKIFLARSVDSYAPEIAEAEALNNMEINDGDKEPVQLTGHYKDDRFIIETLKSNGYTINF